VATDMKRMDRRSDATVRAYLHARGVPFEVILHPRAFTSIAEARAIGVEAGDVVKTVVLDHRREHVLAVIPASRRLDMRLVHQALDDPHAALASEPEVRRAYPEFEAGALPPLGSLLETTMLLDPAVLEHETVIFAAGTQNESLRIRTEDLFGGEDSHVVSISRHMDDET